MADLTDLVAAIRVFNEERDWHRFHDPKSLTLALVGEVGELAELLQWVPAESVRDAAKRGRLHERIAEELSDILIYALMLADEAAVDLADAAAAKLAAAGERYPVADFAGRAPERD